MLMFLLTGKHPEYIFLRREVAMEKGLLKTNLRELRKERKLPQWMVAAGSGVDAARLSILERGAPPRPSEIGKLMAYYTIQHCDIWPDMSGKEV